MTRGDLSDLLPDRFGVARQVRMDSLAAEALWWFSITRGEGLTQTKQA